jgi:uncharacterized membrane-anchored protein YhcB (DUF1043 family)
MDGHWIAGLIAGLIIGFIIGRCWQAFAHWRWLGSKLSRDVGEFIRGPRWR